MRVHRAIRMGFTYERRTCFRRAPHKYGGPACIAPLPLGRGRRPIVESPASLAFRQRLRRGLVALDFQCSFEGIGTSQLVSGNARFHNNSGTITTTSPGIRTGTQALAIGQLQECNKKLLPDQASRVFGFSIYIDPAQSFPASDATILHVTDDGSVGAGLSSAITQVSLCVTSTGKLTAYRGRYHTSGGTKLGSDSTNALVRGVKYFVECQPRQDCAWDAVCKYGGVPRRNGT
jgi:hypothetical protein